MSEILDNAVTSPDGGQTFDFVCPVGSGCGDPATGVGFTSTGWPTRDAALARGQQHFDEHKGLGVMPDVETFRVDQGLSVAPDGSVVRVEDLP